MIIGPRQVGKTTLILEYLKDLDYKFFDGDDPVTRTQLDTPNTEQIRVLYDAILQAPKDPPPQIFPGS